MVVKGDKKREMHLLNAHA